MYTPDVVPPSKVESYDELVFNVAGLFHTMSFLHDPEDWGDEPTASCSSDEDFSDPEPPLERSIPLMIAEFLYRSAMFLGHPQGDTPWLPGFRQDKKFSSNDVKRWRRLAHFDWEAEEQEFFKNHPPRLARTQSVESNGHTRIRNSITSIEEAMEQETEVAIESVDEQNQHDIHKPVSWLNPPPISSSRSLRLLVDIVNSCVYCGQFQFRKRDIVRLCNVKI
ncbi:unnamed protein product [Peronospora destructor]|uniref:Uncharacterized protein n=1 Tax=Peronospora destructor TaxID=86335 RepID=A0AAV0VBF8_9STRA|nr:unnamed protein product [Peronospora destructor]